MKVWNKRFKSRDENPMLEAFNASIVEDRFLYDAEIEASLVYAKALAKASVLRESELAEIESGLASVRKRIESEENLDPYEDIHSAVELMLIEEIGETGKKLHTGRSRNEQVVTDERLWAKGAIGDLISLIEDVQRTVIQIAEENPDVIMPGYTHLQQGQCVLFSHYIMSLFWPLERGKSRLKDAVIRMDASPLGVGALAGSTISIDREYMQNLLGFSSISENSMDAVSDRGYVLELLFVLSMILLDIGRFAEDFIIFSSREFGYVSLDDSIATSSSLMPNKKNPDFFELIRAGSGKLFGYLSQLFITIKGLPMTYNKDLQEDKIPLFRGVEETKTLIAVFHHTLKNFKPNREKMIERLSPHLFATDMVDYLVQHGVPFRDAHGIMGEVVAYAENVNKPLNRLTLDELHGFSPYFQEAVFAVFDPVHSIKQKKTVGSTHPTYVKMQIRKARKLIGESS